MVLHLAKLIHPANHAISLDCWLTGLVKNYWPLSQLKPLGKMSHAFAHDE